MNPNYTLNILPKPNDCFGCKLHQMKPNGFVRHEGRGVNKVLIFGEAGGEQETREGLPFRPRGEAGSVLERAFRRNGMDRDQFGIANIVNCQPPRNWLEGAPWEVSAINSCQVHRDRIVDEYKPKCLLALGGVALRTLTGMSGWKLGITDIRGYVLPSLYTNSITGQPIPIVGSIHPAYLRRSEGLKGSGAKGGASTAETGVLYADMRLAEQVARTGWEFGKYKPDYVGIHNSSPESLMSDLVALHREAKLDPNGLTIA